MQDDNRVRIPRSIVKRPWYTDNKSFRLYLYLMLTCREPGSRYGIKELAEEAGTTVQGVRAALKRLEATGDVVHERHGNWLIITVNMIRGEGGGETN